MTSRRRLCVLALLASAVTFPANAALHAIKGFDEDLAAHGVANRYSSDGLEALRSLVRDEIANVENGGAGVTRDERERLLRIAAAARGVLERMTASTSSATPASAEFAALRSLLYSLRSLLQPERHTFIVTKFFRLLGNRSRTVPYLSPQDRARPLTTERAALEAADLVDPANGTEYGDPAQLAGLSPERVSRLDVRRDDFLWHDEAGLRDLKAKHGTAWQALEALTETRVSEAVHAPYSLDTARRVLLFSGIRSTATSPKIDAKDLYGQPWKLKWGDEVQTEPLANHLYLELGGRFTDLVYANKGGPADLVLVLNEASPSSGGNACDSISHFDQFKRCLFISKYKFDVSAHVVGHGVISEAMLRESPFVSSAATAALIGREYVTFNESLVEFQSEGDTFQAFGAGYMSARGAGFHRAKRGLAIFTYWINNKDAKDANSKGVIDTVDSTYVEYMHDLGASLGSFRYSGRPNLLRVGDDYVRRSSHGVTFRSHLLFEPKAFDAVTDADAMWMVRKIAALSREDILAAVATTRWPDFQQDVVANRLIARRNAITRAFDAGGDLPLDAATTVVSLRTAADRRAAVARYDLAIATHGDAEQALALLEDAMNESGIVMRNGVAEFDDRPDDWTSESDDERDERILETTDCKKSILVALLERTIHPAGLARRQSRRADDKPLKACQPTRESLQLGK